jgi:hypothetical protein
MFFIQFGTVEIEMEVEKTDFPVERLSRGCIVNHRSFLLNDENDCNARCKTVVTAFVLPFNDIDNIRFRSDELDTNIKKIEHEMLGLKNAIAIDYIIQHPPHKRIDRPYYDETHANYLTGQLKNCVVQVWIQVKEQRKKPNLNDILKMVINKKKEDAKRKSMGKKPKKLKFNQAKKTDDIEELSPRSKKYT